MPPFRPLSGPITAVGGRGKPPGPVAGGDEGYALFSTEKYNTWDVKRET